MIQGGESFVPLAEELQNAPAFCGRMPALRRTYSLSACFRDRNSSRHHELCTHLGVIATRNNRGVAREDGATEGPGVAGHRR